MTNKPPILVIGTKSWSSWSLRPWLLMRHLGLPFDEVVIDLRTPETGAHIARYSPSGKVPVLIDAGLAVWDSLAIIEYLADRHPGFTIWPKDLRARAMARMVSCEMHSGFQVLRQNCPMDITALNLTPTGPASVAADVRRIVALWRDCREQFGAGGPFLFGTFTAADAMYAPVVSRIKSYDLDLTAAGDAGHVAARYVETMWELKALAEWRAQAAVEPHPGLLPASL